MFPSLCNRQGCHKQRGVKIVKKIGIFKYFFSAGSKPGSPDEERRALKSAGNVPRGDVSFFVPGRGGLFLCSLIDFSCRPGFGLHNRSAVSIFYFFYVFTNSMNVEVQAFQIFFPVLMYFINDSVFPHITPPIVPVAYILSAVHTRLHGIFAQFSGAGWHLLYACSSR